MTNSRTSIVNFDKNLEPFLIFFLLKIVLCCTLNDLHMRSNNVCLFLVGLVVIDEGLVVHDQHESTEGHVHPVH